MADLKTTNIYGDAYINNKVGIATNAPATRLQIGQLSPTAATEGIQFGDDTGARLHRINTGHIRATGGFSSATFVIADNYLQTNTNLIYPASQTATQRLEVGNASGNAWIDGLTIAQGGNVTVYNNLTTPTATVSGYITFPNDTTAAGLINTAGTAWLRLDDGGGNMHMGNVQSGAGIYCDSNAFYWRTINGATTLLSLSGNGDLGAARYLSGTYVNTSDDVSTGNISHIVAKFGDNYHRSATAAKVAAFISGQTMNIGGNAATVTTNANLSGDVTSVGNTTTIANTVVTNAKLKEMGASTIKGNNSGTATTPSDLTPAQVATMLSGQTMNIAGSSTSCTGNAATATTATALTSMNISQFTNNSGYLTSAVTSLAGTTNRITVSGATGAVTLNLPQDIHTGASPTFAGLSLTSVSTTGATITNLTGAYQNTSVYDSAKTQSATPSRGIRAPASSIQFTDSYAIAPFYTYRSTGDWPVPYGIGWGTGGESSGIFQRYASNGYSFGDMIFYTGNDGYGAFSFRRHTWEGTAQLAAGSGELNTELFRIDWSGNLTMLGTLNGSANSATFYANPSNYGSWKIGGTRNGWYGIEFESGTNLMANSTEVGFYRNGNGWQMRWYLGAGYIYKGSNGGGTEATILDSSNQAYAWNMNQNVRSTDSPTFGTLQLTRLNFGATGATPYTSAAGEGTGNGITFGGDEAGPGYRIFTTMENVGGNYSKLVINWHTGIRIGAYTNYGGIRFYNNAFGAGNPTPSEIFSIGNTDSNVRVVNNLIVNGITINQERSTNARMYGATTGAFGLLGLDSAGSFRWQVYGEGSNYGFLNGAWAGWDIQKTVSGNLYLNGNGTYYLNPGSLTNLLSLTVANTITGAVSGNAGTVTNGFYTTGGQTIAGITYFSNGESINAYGIRGRFTNEYLHLYNKVGVGHPGGWGAGESSTPDKGLSTYGGLNIAYGDNGLSTFNGVIRANSNIRQGADLAMPLSSWSVAGTSTGMVIFSFPGNTGNYGMVHCVFDIYEYNSNTVSTVIVGGHNWSGAWYNIGANVIGRCGKSVRLGVKDSKFCVVFGGAASSWEYGTIILRKIHNGGFYTGIMDMGGSFTTQQTTTESFSNISGDLRLLRTSADFIADGGVTGTSFSGAGTGLTGTASSLSIGGNAATATNLTTNRTNWSTNGTITAVVGQLSWKHYGNNHTIIDASNSTAPDGTAINNTNPGTAWSGTYPTLMGWNGSSTYGVRVDSSRYADQVGYSPNRTDSTAYAVLWGAGSTNTIAYSCAAVTIQSSTGTLTATSFSGAGTGLTGTASSLSIGGNAVTVGGLAVHGGRNNEANKIVRTDSNGYIQAGWINTPSGDMADTQSINKIYCSDDDYVRYKGVADFKQQIGLTYKNATPRSSNTTDSNYWTGIMGWTATDWNSMSDWGCGFVDSWDSPANRPPVGTHHVGVQAIHYTNGTSRYGWQMANGGGNNRWWLRDSWGSSFSTWFEILTSTNYTSFSPSLTGTGASGTWSISITGNAGTATTLATGRAINGVSFNGSAAITVNGLNYNVNDTWLRENGDDAQFQMYGNTRTMIYRTDGNTNTHGGGGYAHIFYYGGSADANRMFIINTDGRLWSNYHGWLDAMNITGNAATAGTCTGNAATVTNGIYTTNYYAGLPLGKRRYRIHSADSTSLNSSITNAECGFTYGGSGEPTGPYIAFGGLGGSIDYSCQLVGAYSGGGNDFKIRTRNDDAASWNTWRTIVTDGNYTSYSPTLTGTGASGTWAISITGNAATVTNGLYTNSSLTAGNLSGTIPSGVLGNSTHYIGTTAITLNRTSSSQTLTGVSIDGNAATATSATSATSATYLNSSNYIARCGSSGNANTDFQNTPAGSVRHNGDDSNLTNSPGGTWWFYDNYRHSNNSNYWGIQVAWGWEDQANKLATRNITGGTFGGWVYYLNSGNYTSYSPALTGTGASGTWGISITGNAVTAGGLAVQTGTNYEVNKIVRTDGNGYVNFGWINTVSGDNGTTAIDRIYASSDAYIRYYTPANFRTVLDVPTRNGSGVTNFGINTAPSNRLHINGDGTNPAIRVDNGAVVLAASAASNSKTFYGWLPISIAGTTKWIQMYN